MYFKLNREMPYHEVDEVLYLNVESDMYEWVESPNYPLYKFLVEKDEHVQNFFSPINVDISIGETIYYIDNSGEIVEGIFNNKSHLKLYLNNRIFKELDVCEKTKKTIDKIYSKNI